LFVHGYLNFDNRKMSKSLGNVIDPLELIDVYGADAVRYYAARVTNFGQDGDVSVDDVRERYERELGNDLGNLVSRTTAMIAQFRGGSIETSDLQPPWDAAELRAQVVAALDGFEITRALEEIWQLVRRLNQYVEESAPWQLAKDDARADELTGVALQPRRRTDGDRGRARAVPPRERAADPRSAPAAGRTTCRSTGSGAAPRFRPEGSSPRRRLFPRIELPTAAQ